MFLLSHTSNTHQLLLRTTRFTPNRICTHKHSLALAFTHINNIDNSYNFRTPNTQNTARDATWINIARSTTQIHRARRDYFPECARCATVRRNWPIQHTPIHTRCNIYYNGGVRDVCALGKWSANTDATSYADYDEVRGKVYYVRLSLLCVCVCNTKTTNTHRQQGKISAMKNRKSQRTGAEA